MVTDMKILRRLGLKSSPTLAFSTGKTLEKTNTLMGLVCDLSCRDTSKNPKIIAWPTACPDRRPTHRLPGSRRDSTQPLRKTGTPGRHRTRRVPQAQRMNIAIIGAGIIGVTTAYELATDGHQVTVFERRGAVAEECSFANAGLISPAQLLLWTAPGMPRKWLRQWGDAHAAMRLGPRLGWGELSWIGQWMRASRSNRSAESRLQLQQLITYSMGRLHQLRQRHALEFDTSTGHLLLIRTPQEHKGLQARLGSLREAGLAFRELNADEARKLEPALNPDSPIEAAIHLPQDEVGNARQFALMIKSEAMRLGVKFEFNSAVDHLSAGPRPTLSAHNEATPLRCHRAVHRGRYPQADQTPGSEDSADGHSRLLGQCQRARTLECPPEHHQRRASQGQHRPAGTAREGGRRSRTGLPSGRQADGGAAHPV